MQQKQLNKAKKCFLFLTVFLLFFHFGSFVYAQTNLYAQSVCELLQNKQKYKGKETLIEATLEIAPETSTFRFEEGCPIIESVTVGNHISFRSNETFENATSLLSLQQKGEEKLGISLRWSVFLRVKIKAKGILQTSNKPKFGFLNNYKNLFLITDIEEIGQSQLIWVGDSFSKNPKIIVARDNNQ